MAQIPETPPETEGMTGGLALEPRDKAGWEAGRLAGALQARTQG